MKGAMLIYRLMPPEVISKTPLAARDLKVELLDCARSALHTEPDFIFGPLRKFSNTQPLLVVSKPRDGDSTRKIHEFPTASFGNLMFFAENRSIVGRG